MRLVELRLINFRKFPDETIVFNNGILGIVGPNGSGKSTIVEGIGYAFYGSQPALTRTGKDDMKRSDAPDGEPWGVILKFEVGKDAYILTRKIKGVFDKYKPEVKLMKNGALVAKDDRVVRNYIVNIIEMGYQAFSSSVFCRQAEVAMLSAMNPAERKKLILKMLRIIGIDDAIKSLRKDIKDADSKIKALDEAFGDMILESIKNKKDKMESDLKDLTKQVDIQNKKKEEFERSIKKKWDEESELLEKRRDIDKKRKKWEEIRFSTERVRIIEQDIKDLNKQIADQEQLLVDVDESLIENIEELKVLNYNLTESLNKKLNRSEMIKEKIKDLCSLTAKCPTCEQEVTGEYAMGLLDMQQRLLDDIEKDIDQVNLEKINIEDDIETSMSECDKKDNNTTIQTRIMDIKNIISKKEDEIKLKIGNIYDKDKHEKVEEELSKMDIVIQNNDSETKKLQTELNLINRDLRDLTGSKASLEAQIQSVEEQLTKCKDNEEKISKYTEKIEKYGMTESVMNDFRMYLIGKVRPMLALFTSQLVNQMTKGRYVKVEMDENYSIMMYDKGIPYPIQRYSGGEQAIVNLALRLALSQMISIQRNTEGLGFIILDEVFGSADTERRETIMETLNGLQNTYSQIICITHIDSVMDMLPNTVTIKSENSISRIS